MSWRGARWAALAGVLPALLGGCGGGPSPPHSAAAPASTVSQTVATVTVSAFNFRPSPLEVPAGATVVWINRDRVRHTVTAGTRTYDDKGKVQGARPSGEFEFDLAETGRSARVTVGRPGRIRYFCAIHPGMDGELLVR